MKTTLDRLSRLLFVITLILIGGGIATIPAKATTPKIYVSVNSSSIVTQADLDGTNGTSLGNLGGLVSSPVGIALDEVNGKMYVANGSGNAIIKANLDGTGGASLGNPNGALSYPFGIAVDATHGKIYAVNYDNGSANGSVSRANLDGTGGENLGDLSGYVEVPNDIALDVAHNKMYISEWGHKIVKANLDGTGAVNLGNLGGTIQYPAGIALDLVNQKMYVTSYLNATVTRANLDGTSPVNLGNPGGLLSNPRGIALDVANGKMYIVCLFNKVIQANLDGTGAVDLGNFNSTLATQYNLAISNVGTPVLEKSTSNLSFGNVDLGSSSLPQTVMITSAGSTYLNITSLTSDSGSFTFSNDSCTGAALLPGQTCTFDVTFTPGSATTFINTISVNSNSLTATGSISVSGTGLSSALSASPTSVDFGDQANGTTSAATTITLTNSGTTDLILGSLTVGSDFAISADNCSGQTVAPSNGCTFGVSFAPSTLGAKGDTLSIPSNAPTSPDTIPLSGTSVTPSAVDLSATSINFGNQAAGSTSAAQTITVTNSGGTGLDIGVIGITGQFGLSDDNCSETTITAGNSCNFKVSFSPTSTGAKTGSVSIPSSASTSPDTVSLSGAGVDTIAPNTVINTHPTNTTASASAAFTFSGTDNLTPPASLTFECKLDGGAYAACSSPKNYSGLSAGTHIFLVRAKDQAGKTDATPASFIWTINSSQTIAVTNGACFGGALAKGRFNLRATDPQGDALTLTFLSSTNSTLVPKANVVISGGPSAFVVTINGVSGKTGFAAILLKLSDGINFRQAIITFQVGTSTADILTGSSSFDMLFGMNGNDTLKGLGESDLLCGGNDDDTLTGGLGGDIFSGGPGTDSATDFNASQGDKQDSTIP